MSSFIIVKKQINHAVMVFEEGGGINIGQVIAMTPNGEAIVDLNGKMILEPRKDCWPVVGDFICRSINSPWEFVPTEWDFSKEVSDEGFALRLSDIAKHFDVKLSTVKKWAGDGMPGSKGKYDLDEINHWLMEKS